jgi:adenylyltransferase/sulfurtransferase
MSDSPADAVLDRYAPQMRFPGIGAEGQRRLLAGRALLCGCGALGSTIGNILARAGLGYLRIVDRDFLELSNLQRQMLFDENDLAAELPKAIAAANKLRAINSQITVEPHVADVTPANVEALCSGVDVILDGTDNFETRFLLNDAAVKLGLPWVYGGCLGAEGQTLTILPGQTPCLRCLIAEPPPPGSSPTCDTAGILGSIIGVVASIQANEAIKIITGNFAAVSRAWTIIDLWDNTVRQVDVSTLRDAADCPTCKQRKFPWLAGQRASHTAVLCGRNAVQVSVGQEGLSLDDLARKLDGVGTLKRTPFFLRLAVDDYLLTIFPDGRAIIGGTDDVALAKTLYARYIGS